MGDENVNMIVNGVYHSTVLGGLIMGNSWAMKKFFKMNPANLGKFDIEDVGKLSASLFTALVIRDQLVKQGFIPENIK